jgi:hypothetical protein
MSKLSRSKLDPGTMKEPDPSQDLEQASHLKTLSLGQSCPDPFRPRFS